MNKRPSAAQIKPRKAEIALRYARKKSGGLPERLKSVPRSEVERLMAYRHGLELPDDVYGRAGLQVLLELGLNGCAALRLAPWCAPELEDLFKKADQNCEARVGITIADRLEVEFHEFEKLKLWHLGKPVDVTAEQIDAWRDGRKKANGKERNRKYRERVKMSAPTSPVMSTDPLFQIGSRASFIFHVPMADGQWWTTRAIADLAGPVNPFTDITNHNTRMRAVRRAVELLDEKLGTAGLVEVKTEIVRSLPVTSIRRLEKATTTQDRHSEVMPAVREDSLPGDEGRR